MDDVGGFGVGGFDDLLDKAIQDFGRLSDLLGFLQDGFRFANHRAVVGVFEFI